MQNAFSSIRVSKPIRPHLMWLAWCDLILIGCILWVIWGVFLESCSSQYHHPSHQVCRAVEAVELDSYCRGLSRLSSCRAWQLDSLDTTDHCTTVETVEATVEAVEAVDLTALSRLSSCRELSMTVDTCCRAVEPGLSSGPLPGHHQRVQKHRFL